MHATSPALIGVLLDGMSFVVKKIPEVRRNHALYRDQHGVVRWILGDDVCPVRRLGDGGRIHRGCVRAAGRTAHSSARGGLWADTGGIRLRRRNSTSSSLSKEMARWQEAGMDLERIQKFVEHSTGIFLAAGMGIAFLLVA